MESWTMSTNFVKKRQRYGFFRFTPSDNVALMVTTAKYRSWSSYAICRPTAPLRRSHRNTRISPKCYLIAPTSIRRDSQDSSTASRSGWSRWVCVFELRCIDLRICTLCRTFADFKQEIKKYWAREDEHFWAQWTRAEGIRTRRTHTYTLRWCWTQHLGRYGVSKWTDQHMSILEVAIYVFFFKAWEAVRGLVTFCIGLSLIVFLLSRFALVKSTKELSAITWNHLNKAPFQTKTCKLLVGITSTRHRSKLGVRSLFFFPSHWPQGEGLENAIAMTNLFRSFLKSTVDPFLIFCCLLMELSNLTSAGHFFEMEMGVLTILRIWIHVHIHLSRSQSCTGLLISS